MRFFCEGCGRLVPVSAFRVEGRALVLVCPQCGREHRSVAPGAPAAGHLEVVRGGAPRPQEEDPLAPPDGVCPKCISPRPEGGQICDRCGLVFANAELERYGPSAGLARAWRKTRERWEQPSAHAEVMRVALAASELAPLARLYRIHLARHPRDPRAKEALDQVVSQAASGALKSDSVPTSAEVSPYARIAVFAVMILAFLALLAFMWLRR